MNQRSMGKTSSYVPLWNKSNYSFLEGASHPEELVNAAQELRLGTIAITDRNGVYGLVRAFVAAKESNVRIVTGSQVSITDGSSLLLLAQNKQGYSNLCSLLSKGHLRNQKGECSVSIDEVCSFAQGLTALWLHPGILKEPDTSLDLLKSSFGNDLYAIVSRHFEKDDFRIERETRELSKRFSISLVAATEALYHKPKRRNLQDVLTCIRLTVSIADAGKLLKPNEHHSLLSPGQIATIYADCPELLVRTNEIAEKCQFSLSELDYRYPDEEVPSGFSTASWLRKLAYDEAKNRYLGSVPDAVNKQLNKELEVIEQLRYSGYFLTMWEIVQYCNREGILCQGRGSAANSAVCFCLGVTAIDPVRMDLLFERFLSLERADPPDIDLDIEHNRREEVIQHMYQKYGRDRAAMVANVVRFRSRSAIREVGKVFGISEVSLDRCSKLLSHWGGKIADAIKESGLELNPQIHKHLVELAEEIRGFPRHLSIHPGGFVLGSEPVHNLVPIENATMPDRTVIQWDKEDIESLNLFKVDLLGMGALTHLDYAFRLLKSHYQKDLSIATIPPSDVPTFEMVQKGDTVGVFQIESRAQMANLPRFKPKNYYDLVIEISLIRPGPIKGGMVSPYLLRRAGLEPITYPHESLIPVLGKTLGIPLFQEQVLKLAMVAADYTGGEADQLRRDMAAWKTPGKIERHRERLVSRMVSKGITEEFADRVFSQIRGFGSYGFPESHAASFAIIAYSTAYLKCHYPSVFACALLNAYPIGFYAPSTIIDDAKRHKVVILPLDVLKSNWECTLEVAVGSPEPAIRIGFRYLKGFSKADWEKILQARRSFSLTSISELKAHCRLPRDSYEQLANSGAFECFGIGRRTSLWLVLEAGAEYLKVNDMNLEKAHQEDLVQYVEGKARFRKLDESELIYWDYESTEHSTRGHVLEPYRSQLKSQGFPDASEVLRLKNGLVTNYAGYAICRQMPGTAGGVMFITLEDETGFVNLVVWERVIQQYKTIILTNWLLGVTGRIQAKDGVVHIIADSFWKPKVSEQAQHTAIKSHDFR